MIIALEGIDGAGKSVQLELLRKHLEDAGHKCLCLSFPNYDGFFGHEIGALLSGTGKDTAMSLPAKSMALWYAMDRFDTLKQYDLSRYDYVLFNRYILSNAAYQGARALSDYGFCDWVFNLELDVLSLPEPDIYISLSVSEAASNRNVAKKGYREYTGHEPDVYEKDSDYLTTVKMVYNSMASRLNNLTTVECMEGGKMLSVQHIHSKIISIVEKESV